MSRDRYSTRETFEEYLANIEQRTDDAESIVEVAKAFVAAVCVLTRVVADVADAARRPER